MIEQSLFISEILIWLLFETWLVAVKVIQNLNCVSFNKYNIPLFCWTGSKKNYCPWLRKSPHSQLWWTFFVSLFFFSVKYSGRKSLYVCYRYIRLVRKLHVYILYSFTSSLMWIFFSWTVKQQSSWFLNQDACWSTLLLPS